MGSITNLEPAPMLLRFCYVFKPTSIWHWHQLGLTKYNTEASGSDDYLDHRSALFHYHFDWCGLHRHGPG